MPNCPFCKEVISIEHDIERIRLTQVRDVHSYSCRKCGAILGFTEK